MTPEAKKMARKVVRENEKACASNLKLLARENDEYTRDLSKFVAWRQRVLNAEHAGYLKLKYTTNALKDALRRIDELERSNKMMGRALLTKIRDYDRLEVAGFQRSQKQQTRIERLEGKLRNKGSRRTKDSES